jgi:hypothetical protein
MAGLSFGWQARTTKRIPMLAPGSGSGEKGLLLCLVSVGQWDCVKELSASGCADEFAIVDDHFPS